MTQSTAEANRLMEDQRLGADYNDPLDFPENEAPAEYCERCENELTDGETDGLCTDCNHELRDKELAG